VLTSHSFSSPPFYPFGFDKISYVPYSRGCNRTIKSYLEVHTLERLHTVQYAIVTVIWAVLSWRRRGC